MYILPFLVAPIPRQHSIIPRIEKRVSGVCAATRSHAISSLLTCEPTTFIPFFEPSRCSTGRSFCKNAVPVPARNERKWRGVRKVQRLVGST